VREQYLWLSGRKEQDETAFLYHEHSDLFTASVIGELRACHDETSAYRETERAAIIRLIAFAVTGSLTLKGCELSKELVAFEARQLIAWEGRQILLNQAEQLLAQTGSLAQRHELSARWLDALSGAQDMRHERLRDWHAGIKQAGYENLLQAEHAWQRLEPARTADQAAQLLTRTESQYITALKAFLPREAGVSFEQAISADLAYLQARPRALPFFARERLVEVYADLFAGLGFNIERQTNVELDLAAHPRKVEQTFCAPLQIPEEIKLVVNPASRSEQGHQLYQAFLCAAGRAQLCAWTSRNLHYEFRVPGDMAVSEAWGALFTGLLREPDFLLGSFGFPASHEFRYALALNRLIATRRAAALAQYEAELHAGQSLHTTGARFVELLSEALRAQHDEAEHLNSLEPGFRAAAALRAWAFEAQLRDYLKTRFGTRWWLSRKAGELLIDLWNTGHRHNLEELAALIGLGELDFAWLATELLAGLTMKAE
jgi:hypothetical protein